MSKVLQRPEDGMGVVQIWLGCIAATGGAIPPHEVEDPTRWATVEVVGVEAGVARGDRPWLQVRTPFDNLLMVPPGYWRGLPDEPHTVSDTTVLDDQTTVVTDGGKTWVCFWPMNEWQRRAIMAGGFKLSGRDNYRRLDDSAGMARYVAGTVRGGGVA